MIKTLQKQPSTQSKSSTGVCVLVPTKNREKLVVERACSSITKQSIQPDLVVIVNDGEVLPVSTLNLIGNLFPFTAWRIIENGRTSGLGGALNSGLKRLKREFPNCFVALLDDDDEWDSDHLEVNLKASLEFNAQVVVSGLRFSKVNAHLDRELPRNFRISDFLVGNPGWQGSNTFVSLESLLAVGGFREGLASCVDRDLAIRLLKHSNSTIAYTGRWTATWHADFSGETLSAFAATSKAKGLGAFYSLYFREMTAIQKEQFFMRAYNFFGINRNMIQDHANSSNTMQLLYESKKE